MMLDLFFSFRQDEEEQKLNENEAQRFIPFEMVIDLIQLLKTIRIYYYFHFIVGFQEWLPERDELKFLRFTTTNKTDNDYNYVQMRDKNRHRELHINLSEDFKELAETVKITSNVDMFLKTTKSTSKCFKRCLKFIF